MSVVCSNVREQASPQPANDRPTSATTRSYPRYDGTDSLSTNHSTFDPAAASIFSLAAVVAVSVVVVVVVVGVDCVVGGMCPRGFVVLRGALFLFLVPITGLGLDLFLALCS